MEIHPFRDGNGRVSRLLFLLQCHHLDYEVGRYIGLERIIEENKDRYSKTLDQSSQGWHEGKHDPWPYILFLLIILKTAYKEFENRLERIKSLRGEKTLVVVQAINRIPGVFRVTDIQKQCPGVSIDMIRGLLKKLRVEDRIECLGRGQKAQWKNDKKMGLGNTD